MACRRPIPVWKESASATSGQRLLSKLFRCKLVRNLIPHSVQNINWTNWQQDLRIRHPTAEIPSTLGVADDDLQTVLLQGSATSNPACNRNGTHHRALVGSNVFHHLQF